MDFPTSVIEKPLLPIIWVCPGASAKTLFLFVDRFNDEFHETGPILTSFAVEKRISKPVFLTLPIFCKEVVYPDC